ncbi:MAG TPA: N,N-dimethylformamidase, partial [Candidatus Latescibacteria bacterium]|nr:N,N-dimethylformamidase [Candidatus Latescibacterota bacterium]
MLIGYVSDERYVAVSGVLFELEGDGASVEVRSRATGSVYADVAPGEYLITLHKSGYGSKRVKLSLPVNEPYNFRLLKDGLLGYMWPKWVQAGERSE